MADTKTIVDVIFTLKNAYQAIVNTKVLMKEEEQSEKMRKGSIEVEYRVII